MGEDGDNEVTCNICGLIFSGSDPDILLLFMDDHFVHTHRISRGYLEASIRRAAYRAWVQEMEWSHPRRGDCDDLQACADPKCRFCRNVRGEVRDGFAC